MTSCGSIGKRRQLLERPLLERGSNVCGGSDDSNKLAANCKSKSEATCKMSIGKTTRTFKSASTLILICFLITCCCCCFCCCTSLEDTQQVIPLKPPNLDQAKVNHIVQDGAIEASRKREEKKNRLEELKHDNVHKFMSQNDLRRTFQVDTHDQVPEYEVLKWTVHEDGSHLISPISDLGELVPLAKVATKQTTKITTKTTKQTTSPQENDHQKKRHKRSSLHEEEEAYNESSQQFGQPRNEDGSKQVASELESDNLAGAKATSYQPSRKGYKETRGDNGEDEERKLIVMNLNTFGRDFKLRLKRNVDFQQRIKDMKMFMAESTGDGQLRYTEIKQQQQPAATSSSSSHHKQEPHKREATASNGVGGNIEPSSSVSSTSSSSSTPTSGQSQSPSLNQQETVGKGASSAGHKVGAPTLWNIGSTYHDEDNLAALLIEHDSKTGQFQVDGTIGNDFVIKPMPTATIEALMERQQERKQQELLRRQKQQWFSTSTKMNTTSPTHSSLVPLQSTSVNGDNVISLDETTSNVSDLMRASSGANNITGYGNGSALERAAHHLHDDDPHDDDEMFLDEDEALELAHLQSSVKLDSNYTSTSGVKQQQLANSSNHLPHQVRPLSKAASERKWKKYRKFMAQTQVPKSASSSFSTTTADETSLPSSSFQRARRHIETDNEQPTPVTISHHIVYRQRPSAEGSSSAHQHSFMMTPQQQSMDQVAASFSSRRLGKRSLKETGNDNDNVLIENLAPRFDRAENEADFEHDPLGGQFYLEPASVMGTQRAGFSDWSLVSEVGSGANSRLVALPPYALNETSHPHLNGTHARYKRQAGRLHLANSQVRRKRQAPDTVWPEVLLVVDYDSFLLHGGDSRDVKRYFVSFWNGVDLRYKLLVHPHIRISLAGMIVAKDRDATPYLERNRLRAPNADAVDAAGALTDMGKYLYREDRLPTYDLAVVITKLDMCRRRYEGGRCNRGTAGFAYVGGACVVNKRLEKVNSVAIIEDSGGFSGIIVAAHEVGHLLGCVHDGSPPPSYLGGPGATHCPWEDGFIMSDLRHTERGFRWSQCSVEQFKHFLNGETATCLYNYPHESQMLHRLLPGTMLSLDEQCKRDRGTNACFKDARVCAQLFCFDSASGYCVSYRPAAEGSPCGEGQVCRNGKCVGEIENIIPDYTHQSQTVVARRPAHPVSRLADNGLSASSTSTATSSPDSKMAANPVAQITSRMDTFPMETPLVSTANHYGTSNNYQYGGRNNNLMLMRQASSPASSTTTLTGSSLASGGSQAGKSAKLQDRNDKQQQSYQQRSGQQAIKIEGANRSKRPSTISTSGSHSTKQASQHLYSTTSSLSQQNPSSTIGGNNLLTSSSPFSQQPSNNLKQQQHQRLYQDDQRVKYQQQQHQANYRQQLQSMDANTNARYNQQTNNHVNRIVNQPHDINEPETSVGSNLYNPTVVMS